MNWSKGIPAPTHKCSACGNQSFITLNQAKKIRSLLGKIDVLKRKPLKSENMRRDPEQCRKAARARWGKKKEV